MAETGGIYTPPKDFVCPITSNIFDDPVTLATGQTYERKAIQEWIDRGNSTCPITRQNLHGSDQLPKTNYLLKRLIASWRMQNPGHNNHASTPPNDVMLGELHLAITSLCTSEVLAESELAVLNIEKLWFETDGIQNLLSKPPVINGFVEILFNSVDTRVLAATIFLLSELGSRENSVIETLTRVDSDVECVVALFKQGFINAIVLIYLLQPSTKILLEMEIVDSLLAIIAENEDEESSLNMCMNPKTASVILLGQIFRGSDERSVSEITEEAGSEKVIESIVFSLQAEWIEERSGAVSILSRSMINNGKCRKTIADKADLSLVLDSFVLVSTDEDRFEIVLFLSELLKFNRRMINVKILEKIKEEGSLSTMHILLVYLQTAPQDQLPIVAALLLQLDLLGEPIRKASIYREEAIDVLLSCLRNTEFPAIQIAAAETILFLQGRFSSNGKPLVRAILLKRAGLEKNYRSQMRKEQRSSSKLSADTQDSVVAEKKAAEEWETKMANAFVSHESGVVFEVLAEGLKSRYAELCSACFVSATWLVHMLSFLPDTGIKETARVCLLKLFVSIFKSAKDNEDRALSMLAINTFITDPEGLEDVTVHMKDILKGLRELKKYSGLAFEMLQIFSEGSDASTDYWNHKELYREDCSLNGQVLSIVCFNGKIISGHSDGTIKVWSIKGGIDLNLIQETREHSKAVTTLVIVHSKEMILYSGSLDRTVRAWSIHNEVIHCEQVYEMNDHVKNLVVANSISCFIPQGSGIKVNSWNGESKLLNPNKNVKCLALVQEKLYCGCHDNSIQEIDLATGTLTSIQSSSRKLMGRGSNVNALQVYDGLVYSASDGAALKIWSRDSSNYSMIGSLPSTMEIRAMAVSSELIYLGGKGGILEIWCKKKNIKRETLQIHSNGKVQCMALDSNEEVLIIGTSDGIIQVWGLS